MNRDEIKIQSIRFFALLFGLIIIIYLLNQFTSQKKNKKDQIVYDVTFNYNGRYIGYLNMIDYLNNRKDSLLIKMEIIKDTLKIINQLNEKIYFQGRIDLKSNYSFHITKLKDTLVNGIYFPIENTNNKTEIFFNGILIRNLDEITLKTPIFSENSVHQKILDSIPDEIKRPILFKSKMIKDDDIILKHDYSKERTEINDSVVNVNIRMFETIKKINNQN